MDFVQASVENDITDWNEWINKYVYVKSDLYNVFKSLVVHIPFENHVTGGMVIVSPFVSWINMLKNCDTVETIETTNCFCIKNRTRKQVLLDGKPIAIIDKFGSGKFGSSNSEYKYVSIPSKCYGDIMASYVDQML